MCPFAYWNTGAKTTAAPLHSYAYASILKTFPSCLASKKEISSKVVAFVVVFAEVACSFLPVVNMPYCKGYYWSLWELDCHIEFEVRALPLMLLWQKLSGKESTATGERRCASFGGNRSSKPILSQKLWQLLDRKWVLVTGDDRSSDRAGFPLFAESMAGISVEGRDSVGFPWEAPLSPSVASMAGVTDREAG